MNLEEVYTLLRGASDSTGAKYDVVKKWFTKCSIIDNKYITAEFFTISYERLGPNHEELTLTQFIQLLGILSRETHQNIHLLEKKFLSIKQEILEEIQERIREERNKREKME